MLKVGDFVWSKTAGYPFWPGQIESPTKIHDGVRKAGKAGQVLVKYINDKNFGWVYEHELLEFQQNYSSMVNQRVRKSLMPAFKKAVQMAKEAYNRKKTQGHQIEDDADAKEDVKLVVPPRTPGGLIKRAGPAASTAGTSQAATSAPAGSTRSSSGSRSAPAAVGRGNSQSLGGAERSRVPRIRVRVGGSVAPRPAQTSPSERGSESEGPGGKEKDRGRTNGAGGGGKKRSRMRLDDVDDPYKKERVSYRRPRPPRPEPVPVVTSAPTAQPELLEPPSSTSSARSSSASLPAPSTAIATRSSGPVEEPQRKDDSDVDTYSAPKRRHNINEVWPYIISLADDLLDHKLINEADATEIKMKAVHKDEQLRTIYLAASLSDGVGKLQRFARSYRDVFARSMC